MNGYLGETIIGEENGVKAALRFIEKYGQIDGDHHKAWVLDQVARVLLGTPVIIKVAKWENGYSEERFVTGIPSKKYLEWSDEMRADGYEYDEGLAP